ncbi:hypothetical protein LguiA_002999 [Lonicera macranthoides]
MKTFTFKFDRGGDALAITEEHRQKFFKISMGCEGVGWLIRNMEEAIKQGNNKRFFSKFQGSDALFLLQSNGNNHGRFLSLIKILRGIVKEAVVFPAGRNEEGWKVISRELRLFTYDHPKRKEDVFRETQKVGVPCQSNEETTVGKKSSMSYAEVTKMNMTKTNNISTQEYNTKEWNFRQDKDGNRDWKKVIVCTRTKVWDSWGQIQKLINQTFDGDFVLKPFQPDKAIFLCENRELLKRFEQEKVLSLNNEINTGMQVWNSASVSRNKKMVFTGGWLSIEDLPLKWWTREVFEIIGKRCGGLMEFDSRTATMKQIFSAKIRAKGNDSGFIPAEIDMCIEDEVFTIKLRVMSKFNTASRGKLAVSVEDCDLQRHRIIVTSAGEEDSVVCQKERVRACQHCPSVQRSMVEKGGMKEGITDAVGKEHGEMEKFKGVINDRGIKEGNKDAVGKKHGKLEKFEGVINDSIKVINDNSNSLLINVGNIFETLSSGLSISGPADGSGTSGINKVLRPVGPFSYNSNRLINDGLALKNIEGDNIENLAGPYKDSNSGPNLANPIASTDPYEDSKSEAETSMGDELEFQFMGTKRKGWNRFCKNNLNKIKWTSQKTFQFYQRRKKCKRTSLISTDYTEEENEEDIISNWENQFCFAHEKKTGNEWETDRVINLGEEDSAYSVFGDNHFNMEVAGSESDESYVDCLSDREEEGVYLVNNANRFDLDDQELVNLFSISETTSVVSKKKERKQLQFKVGEGRLWITEEGNLSSVFRIKFWNNSEILLQIVGLENIIPNFINNLPCNNYGGRTITFHSKADDVKADSVGVSNWSTPEAVNKKSTELTSWIGLNKEEKEKFSVLLSKMDISMKEKEIEFYNLQLNEPLRVLSLKIKRIHTDRLSSERYPPGNRERIRRKDKLSKNPNTSIRWRSLHRERERGNYVPEREKLNDVVHATVAGGAVQSVDGVCAQSSPMKARTSSA